MQIWNTKTILCENY